MRRAEKPTFLKSGFSPVQFNYQPLPESISAHRRESLHPWLGQEEVVWTWRIRFRLMGSSRGWQWCKKSRTFGRFVARAAREWIQLRVRWCRWRAWKTRRRNRHRKVWWGFATFFGTFARRYENAQKIQRIPKIRMQTSPQATRMCRRMVMSNRTIDRKCTLRKRRKERVSDLVNAWNNRTAEVLDV